MEHDCNIFKTFSQFLIQITNRLQNLSLHKTTFSKDINYQVNPFYQLLKKQLNSNHISINSFAQLFQVSKNDLYYTMFRENNKPTSKLSPQRYLFINKNRLCTYLKTSIQNLKKTYSTQPIPKAKIIQFVTIVKEQIQILTQTKNIFTQHQSFLQKLFEEIDFFNNRYIDCASFAEFFNHYSSDQEQNYSQTGCILLIQMIKGYESTGEKLFLQDLLEFVQDKQLLIQEGSQVQDISGDKRNSKQSINFDCILQKSDFSNSSIINDSLEYRTSSRRSYFDHRSSIDQQSVIPRKNQESIDEQEMMVNLSISQSMSPKSVKDRNFFCLGNSFSKTYHKDSLNNLDHITGHRITFSAGNGFDDFPKDDKNPLIKVQHEYQISERLKRVEHNQEKGAKELNEKAKKSIFLQIAQQQKDLLKQKQKSVFQNSPFKSFVPQQSSRIPSTLRQQRKLVYASSLSNNFESSLIRSHSRNLAYLSQVKLSDKSTLKIIENCESTATNRTKNITRPCLSSKTSIFEGKKVEFVFTLQSLVEEYARWYSAVEQLIMKYEKFTFLSAFSVIDTNETNEVAFGEFKDFLKDAGIQKKYEKIEFFFNHFSVFKSALKRDCENKQNMVVQKQKEIEISTLKVSQFQEKVMRYSDFLKIFYLQKTIPLLMVCKKRPGIIQNKWEEKMKSSYCNFFRVVMDSCYEIEMIIKNLKKIYIQMRQICSDQTFQKTFGRQIMRFDQMQKILGSNSTTLLCEISKEDQYVDEQKLMRYLKMEIIEEQ